MHKTLARLVPVLLLAGCASASKYVPDVSMPDFSSWFSSEHAIEVQEVARADVCFTSGGESEVTKVPDLVALQAWAQARGVLLVKETPQDLPQTAYAIVEFGAREHSGYGLAISKQGGLKNGAMVLKGTFFEPQPGRWASNEASSPCVVVSLPSREYKNIRVIDQTGRVRAATEGAL